MKVKFLENATLCTEFLILILFHSVPFEEAIGVSILSSPPEADLALLARLTGLGHLGKGCIVHGTKAQRFPCQAIEDSSNQH